MRNLVKPLPINRGNAIWISPIRLCWVWFFFTSGQEGERASSRSNDSEEACKLCEGHFPCKPVNHCTRFVKTIESYVSEIHIKKITNIRDKLSGQQKAGSPHLYQSLSFNFNLSIQYNEFAFHVLALHHFNSKRICMLGPL